ncbi:homoserine dehydrogenase [Bacilli bacterium PM5-3]|nr:homoserine dehydrogenase [Bacilli bacterium PM5-3]MDH6603626.1 homoserine dehydrogenase [Bacilli bacterium PM5-9]
MKVAILGLGVVGSGVYKQLLNNIKKIEQETEVQFEIAYGLVKEITPPIKKEFSKIKLTTNVMDILDDDSVDCIIEVMGSIDFAYEVIKRALKLKKHVVSANKDLIALHGVELMKLAKENNCDFYFEASVAGGVPIIRSITKGLASDYLYDIKGILNGTSNYILTKMSQDGLSYDDALAQAKELGFAEADPTNDVAGYDAARKVAILAMLCYFVDAKFSDVDVVGIENVSLNDIEFAHKLDCEIKLIGHSHYENGKLSLSVMPSFVSINHQLAMVSYEMNAVYVSGQSIGDLMLFGAGAGSNPTATAVMSDLLEVARNFRCNCNGRDIVIPTNKKEIVNDEEVNKYIFIANDKVLQDILTIVNVVKHTKDYVISEISRKEVNKILADYDCKAYPILEA